VITQTNDE